MLLSSRILFLAFIFFAQLGFSQVTFMTFNIRYATPNDSINSWENRKTAVGEYLQKSQIDFLGIQEGLIHQVRDIEFALGDNYHWFGIGRDHGDTSGEHCAIFYNHKKFKAILTDDLPTTFWLSRNINLPSKSWDAAFPRIVTVGLFEDVKDGQKWLVLNTHFDHVGKKARRKSMKLIYKHIQKWSNDSTKTVLMGDFNLLPSSKPIRWISKRMDDLGTNQISKGTFNGFHKNEPINQKRIDYIFSKNSNTIEYKIDYFLRNSESPIKYLSDHYPVVAILN